MYERRPPPFEFDLVPGAYAGVRGFRKPQWDVIGEWIASNVPADDQPDVWWSAEWWALHRIADDFGPNARWVDGEYSSIMTTRPESQAQQFLARVESRWDAIRKLHHLPRKEAAGSNVVVIDDRAAFLRYIDADDAVAPQQLTACYGPPAGHVVLGPGAPEAIAWALNDGISFIMAAYCPWPAWLVQGMCMLAQDAPAIAAFNLDAISNESLARMRLLWNPTSIQQFWVGDSFGAPDDRSPSSLILGEALARQILDLPDAAARAFFDAADWRDAGAAAATRHLGVSLSELVSRVLGAGRWDPAPDAWPSDDDPR